MDQPHVGRTGGRDQMVDQVQVELGRVLSSVDISANLGVDHIILCVCDARKRTICQHCIYGASNHVRSRRDD